GAESEEIDDCRGIDGRRVYRDVGRGWHPAPAVIALDPTPVVAWRKTPGGIVDPGPAPGLDIGPGAVSIGHISWFRRRIPHLSVFRRRFPRAIVGQIQSTSHATYHFRHVRGQRLRLLARKHRV